MTSPPTALAIAGSDSAGCAGIQADLRTFAALGVHGMSVITCVTAQDTRRVHLATDLPLENIELQIRAVIEDIGVNAVKTGMLSSGEIVSLVARELRRHRVPHLVVDPVMASTAGDPLLDQEAIGILKQELFPLATTVTPNLCEAEILTGRRIEGPEDAREAAREILELGPHSVVVTGGHFEDPGSSTDYFYDGRKLRALQAKRVETVNTRGSGCTFASAIAAYLARGLELGDAVHQAKQYVTEAIRRSYPLGHGPGPLGHFPS